AYSFDLLVADVVALMDALSIKRAHFAGLSMGGVTALFLAKRHPERFDRIVACDCVPASTPTSAQQWKERIEIASKDGMAALVELEGAGHICNTEQPAAFTGAIRDFLSAA